MLPNYFPLVLLLIHTIPIQSQNNSTNDELKRAYQNYYDRLLLRNYIKGHDQSKNAHLILDQLDVIIANESTTIDKQFKTDERYMFDAETFVRINETNRMKRASVGRPTRPPKCEVEANPAVLANCVTIDLSSLIVLGNGNVTAVCETANNYMQCIKEKMVFCTVGHLVAGAITELQALLMSCCPKRPHQKVNPDCPVIQNPPECFSAKDKIQRIKNGQTEEVFVSQLQIHDKVEGFDSINNQLMETEIIGWLHYNPTISGRFLKVTAISQNDNEEITLDVTPAHLIAFNENEKLIFQPASKIRLNTILYGKNGNFIVKKIESEELTGVFTPLTSSGTIMVNKISASCYTIDHTIGHIALSPLRQLPHLATMLDNNGINSYANILLKFISIFS
ncbi:hypothetical protein SNEBB_009860 [Seison nebaliae]|nr:hypothetical protein SNEBB_009860 [Seison nebaliae]